MIFFHHGSFAKKSGKKTVAEKWDKKGRKTNKNVREDETEQIDTF